MKTNGKESFLARTPSWALALLTVVIGIIVLFGSGEGLGKFIKIKGDIGESIPYILYDLVLPFVATT